MRIFQGLGSLSEVLSKAKKLILHERRETFRVRISPSAFRAVCRDRQQEADGFDEAAVWYIVEQAKRALSYARESEGHLNESEASSSHPSADREKIVPNFEPKKKET